MSNIAKFNVQLAMTLGLPAAIMLKRLVNEACDNAVQAENPEGPLGITRSVPGIQDFPYLRPDQIDDGVRQLVAAGFVQKQPVGDSGESGLHITEKALEAEDKDGELEWKVCYKSAPFKPSYISPTCLF